MAQGNARILVSQLLRQTFDGHAGHEHMTHVCVAKDMERHTFQLRSRASVLLACQISCASKSVGVTQV